MRVSAQVTWDAKQLEGTSEGDMGTKGAGGVLAVLDLRADEGLQEAGFAREVLSLQLPMHRAHPEAAVGPLSWGHTISP